MTDPVLGDLAPEQVRVRFPPSPTGFIHVGNVRSALFNWAFARHYGGTLVLRIEDTDLARNTDEGYASILDSLRWLGIGWDEGPEVGGPYAPYRQSERFGIYADVAARLREGGKAYDCYCTTEEVDARRKAAGSKIQGYDGHCRELSDAQRDAFLAEGRRPTLRLRMPDAPITFDDLVRGEITFLPEHVPDFALLRANGDPLYTLVNPVDDALMGITHVLRGEDLLSSTPRQIALYEALHDLGVGTGAPRFGHLPIVMGEGNKRLSKRDKGSGLSEYIERGFLPEGLLNYLALLGWGIAADRDVFTMAEMVEAFDIRRVNPNPARFDLKKLEAINTAHMRRLSVEDITHRAIPFLKAAGVVSDPVSDADAQLLELAMPLVAERINTLSEAPAMLGFLFVDEAAFTRDPADVEKLLNDDGRAVVARGLARLEYLEEWSAAAIQETLQSELVDGMGLKPRVAFGPLRVAVTGRRVSPPLFESMELLGRERSLSRLRSVLV
ncbi:glutamate--tRNA ligase [Nocardioides sp. cx-173]|uniref:glutamate--tRNA ligase n=1 Tax=Nocardioides sp. cx-173 TaxID=2898796 RepID=UPI001E41B4A1|nr:glutamate--tRNA ligase [Nocardioides sp. cx-173]MCD4524729.1 glutamate--tRNA ligase [Nocardioides sp. cx-173]UGB43239.1 glutamate--tRNA ligase [Nocardioides sp. cx-173]